MHKSLLFLRIFIYLRFLCRPKVKALVRLRICAGSSEPLMLANAIITVPLNTHILCTCSRYKTKANAQSSKPQLSPLPWPTLHDETRMRICILMKLLRETVHFKSFKLLNVKQNGYVLTKFKPSDP